MSKSTDLAFKECPTCAAKPGTPVLCPSCLHNRQMISTAITLLAERPTVSIEPMADLRMAEALESIASSMEMDFAFRREQMDDAARLVLAGGG